jgi:cullin 3
VAQGLNRDNGTDFEQCWELIADALRDIHTKNAGKLSFEQLYRASYKIVLKKKGGDLYERVKVFEERWFHDRVIPGIQGLITANLINVALRGVPGSSTNERRVMGERFLRGIMESWEAHNMSMNMTADFLMYLDRGYAQDQNQASIYSVTIGLYRDHILRASLDPQEPEQGNVFEILNAVMLDLINMEREGDQINRTLLRHCVAMLEDLYETVAEREEEKLYLTSFEGPFLENSEAFYKAECIKLLRDADAHAWLQHTHRRLVEEQDRCQTTISPLSERRITAVVEQELIRSHLGEFLALETTGLKAMIDNNRHEDLSILYQLVSRVDSKREALKSTLHSRIIDLGMEIEKGLKETNLAVPADGGDGDGTDGPTKTLSASAQQTVAAIKWVNDIMALKNKFDELWELCFNRDKAIETSLTSSFSELFRICQRSSEYVSLFIDDLFKRGLRGRTDDEVEASLNMATVMICHLTDKDMFERYYQKHLARRLLHNKSEHPEAEMLMITRMQQHLGKTFTTKFEGMFKDMTTSSELSRDYQDYVKNLGDADHQRVDLSISVLTWNNWPPEVASRPSSDMKSGLVECSYPPEIKRLQQSFRTFYLKDRSGRAIYWVGSAGSADIKCVFPKIEGQEKGPLSRERRYEINVPTHGMVVLMLFNDLPDNVSLSFEEIQARTNIPENELIRALASLSIPPKCRVLMKSPLTKQVKEGDRFSFNTAFVSKTVRIKAPVISAVSKVEGEEERRTTEDKNNQTRAHIIDAAVVRIMKYGLPLIFLHSRFC